MSTVNGTITVDVQFRDSTTSSGVQSLKTIALRDTTEYTTGKVAVLTGTAGTATVSLGEYGETPYKDSSGTAVDFNSISRVAFSWSGTNQRTLTDGLTSPSSIVLNSSGGRGSVTDFSAASVQPTISAGTGTGTYTIVLYGT